MALSGLEIYKLLPKTNCRECGYSTCLAFAMAHTRQSIIASITAGCALTIVTGLILIIGELSSPYTWVVLILYFTLCHTALILLGILGYARANAGKPFMFFHYATWWG